MNKRSIRNASLLALSVLLATHAAAQTSPPSGAAAKPAGEQDKTLNCPDGLVKFLPGEFYACEARVEFARGHYDAMIDRLKDAAYWADKNAQYQLGLAYFNGDLPGIAQNKALGLAWLALAAERQKQQFRIAYGVAQAQASPEDIREASRLLKQMIPTYSDSVAATRAIRFFNDAIKPIDHATMYGGKIWIRGVTTFAVTNVNVANWLHSEANAEFEDWHGTVTIGGPDWLSAPPPSANSSPAASSTSAEKQGNF